MASRERITVTDRGASPWKYIRQPCKQSPAHTRNARQQRGGGGGLSCCSLGGSKAAPFSPSPLVPRPVPRPGTPTTAEHREHTRSSSPLFLTISPPVELQLQVLDNILQSLVFLFLFFIFLLPFFRCQFQVHGDSVLDGLGPGVKDMGEMVSVHSLNRAFPSHRKAGTGEQEGLSPPLPRSLCQGHRLLPRPQTHLSLVSSPPASPYILRMLTPTVSRGISFSPGSNLIGVPGPDLRLQPFSSSQCSPLNASWHCQTPLPRSTLLSLQLTFMKHGRSQDR